MLNSPILPSNPLLKKNNFEQEVGCSPIVLSNYVLMSYWESKEIKVLRKNANI